MNPKFAYLIFSFKRELKFVLVAFCIAISIPIIAIILLTQIGLDIISDKLVSVNEQTQNVEIHDPVTGEAIPLKVIVSWPTFGVITLEFGQSSGFQIFHTGIDIANAYGQIGDPINPFLPGKVIYAGEISWGYGKHIIIDHGNNITSIYAHLDKIFVVKGQEITSTKQVIGRMGSTGWSTGPHLHFEVRVYGIPVNPRTFLGAGNP
ncbi:MAG: M23 family metallopeptidase [Microgenomates group bacterium]|jgi:murein DD-endopeptidase MepM/ murein hydrolase activator NlpD